VGHVIGLVDNGLAMVDDHKDPDHGPHSIDPDCVMYWAYAGGGVFDHIVGSIFGTDVEAIQFDQHCLDDIAALRDAP
jgi:hypothetical protein